MMTAFGTCHAQKTLVLYYSESGTTKTVAEEFQKQLNADIESIECVKPYTGNFQETIQRGQKEAQSGEWPELKPLKKKISDYDVIFLGYPIWFGTYANPIGTLVKNNDFAGKTIVPFCTFGSGGLNTSSDELKKALPKAKIQEGYGVRTARVASAEKELDRFLKENGYKKGYEKNDSEVFKKVLFPKLEDAMHNANVSLQKRIAEFNEVRPNENRYPYCDWNSCTTVHKLIEDLKIEI